MIDMGTIFSYLTMIIKSASPPRSIGRSIVATRSRRAAPRPGRTLARWWGGRSAQEAPAQREGWQSGKHRRSGKRCAVGAGASLGPQSTSTGTRKQIEDASRPTLVKLSSLPRLVVPLGTLVLVALGLFAPLPIALPALALIFFFFAWIAYLSWPVVPTGGKVLRGVMLGLVLAMAVSRF